MPLTKMSNAMLNEPITAADMAAKAAKATTLAGYGITDAVPTRISGGAIQYYNGTEWVNMAQAEKVIYFGNMKQIPVTLLPSTYQTRMKGADDLVLRSDEASNPAIHTLYKYDGTQIWTANVSGGWSYNGPFVKLNDDMYCWACGNGGNTSLNVYIYKKSTNAVTMSAATVTNSSANSISQIFDISLANNILFISVNQSGGTYFTSAHNFNSSTGLITSTLATSGSVGYAVNKSVWNGTNYYFLHSTNLYEVTTAQLVAWISAPTTAANYTRQLQKVTATAACDARFEGNYLYFSGRIPTVVNISTMAIVSTGMVEFQSSNPYTEVIVKTAKSNISVFVDRLVLSNYQGSSSNYRYDCEAYITASKAKNGLTYSRRMEAKNTGTFGYYPLDFHKKVELINGRYILTVFYALSADGNQFNSNAGRMDSADITDLINEIDNL